MEDKEDYIRGYIQGIKVENDNSIRNIEEYLFELKTKREERRNGDRLLVYKKSIRRTNAKN